jgi:CBS domain-containing protein
VLNQEGKTMPIIVKQSTLAGLSVKEAIRKQVVSLHRGKSLEEAIHLMGKHKLNTVLVTDDDNQPAGVVSKTDIMGAYYAALPLDSPLDYVMSSPPVFCRPDDLMETALDQMRSHKIHGLYVSGETPKETTGILTYADIVGLLYQYCHQCKFSKLRVEKVDLTGFSIQRFRAKDVMSNQVVSLDENESLNQIMEALSAYRFGAVLITNEKTHPCGMFSKTDLVFFFKQGVPPDAPVKTIMSTHVVSCEENDYLEIAIERMILAEVQRIFVYKESSENISGVISLSDTARLRSGSCHACVSSRIRVAKHG